MQHPCDYEKRYVDIMGVERTDTYKFLGDITPETTYEQFLAWVTYICAEAKTGCPMTKCAGCGTGIYWGEGSVPYYYERTMTKPCHCGHLLPKKMFHAETTDDWGFF
jgi:hypothetical protein